MTEQEPILLSEKVREKGTWTMVKPHIFTVLLLLLSALLLLLRVVAPVVFLWILLLVLL